MRKIIIASIICAATLYARDTSAQVNAGAGLWKPLQFLVGTWEAKTKGGSAGAVATGTYTFQFQLKHHILSRLTATGECRGPADFNCEHSDLLYIYPGASPGSLKAIFFDNEGHVIHYNVSTGSASNVVLVSDPSQPGPQYRLSYELKENELLGKFEMRMPDRDEFTTYLEWGGRRK